MKQLLFTFCILLTTSPSFAFFDYQASINGQSLPFSGGLAGSLGYNLLVWGDDPLAGQPSIGYGGRPEWRYGYIRPNFVVQSAGIVNGTVAELDLFPISIAGITVGQSVRYKNNQSFQFDCDQYVCGGVLSKTYLRGQIVAGGGGIFGVLSGRYELISAPGNLPFVDETYSLVGLSGRDQLSNFSGSLGYVVNEKWMAGLYSSYSRMIGTGDSSLLNLAYANYYYGRFGLSLGGGLYSSNYQPVGVSMIAGIQVMGQRPLGFR